MARGPDILWVTLESVRADHTPLYGYERDTTPHLRELSGRADATVLEEGISASMWTPASSASMLTGTHLSTHNVGRDGKGEKKLPDRIDTFPELLRRAGYETALFSSVSYLDAATGLDRGFEHSQYLRMERSNFSHLDAVGRDSWRCCVRRWAERPTIRPGELAKDLSDDKNCLVARQAKRWFRRQYSGDRPFFVYAHVFSPHHAYLPIRRFIDAFADEIEMDVWDAYSLSERVYADAESINSRIANGLQLSESEWEAIEALYDSEILYADHTANEIVEAAESASTGDLIIVVTADHGDLFGECGLIGHSLVLHDGLIKVPMLVIGIDDIEDGDGKLSQHVDLTYTLASVTGTLTDQFEGRDLRDPDRDCAISQRGSAALEAYTKHNPEFETSQFFEDPYTSVRTTDHKYVTNHRKSVLYELPDEQTNVMEEYPSIVESLAERLVQEGIDWSKRPDQEPAEFSSSARSRLRDLGYLS